MPQKLAGPRIEPPVSVPIDSGTIAAASALPDPLDEPLGVRVKSHGLRAGPNPETTPLPIANSSRFNLPASTAPALASRSVIVDSLSGTAVAVTFEPLVVSSPLVARMSFGAYGMP